MHPVPTSSPAHDGHLDVLDGIRGLAILLVMQTHFYGLPLNISGTSQPLVIDRAVYALVSPGWSGVDLFFVLSGFLITGILVDAKGSPRFFRNFFARRALRILPVYYGYLLLVLLVLPAIGVPEQFSASARLAQVQGWFWTFLVNVGGSLTSLAAGFSTVHGPFWSLAVEEQFYLLWPVVVYVLDRRSLKRLCVFLVVFAPMLRAAMLLFSGDSAVYLPFAAATLMPARADVLAIGGLLALTARENGGLARFDSAARRTLLAGGAALLAMTVLRKGLRLTDPVTMTLGFSLLLGFYASLLVRVVTSAQGSAVRRLFVHPGLLFFGRHSYAMYVFHLLVAFLLCGLMAALQDTTGRSLAFSVAGTYIPFNLLFNACATATVALVSWLVWHLYEKWFLSCKRYFPYGAKPGRIEGS